MVYYNHRKDVPSNKQEEVKMKKYNLSKIMKMAWEVVRKAGATIAQGMKFAWACAKKEVALKEEWAEEEYGKVTFNVWSGYGHTRAYYKCSWLSKYQNSKKTNFVEM